VRPSDTRSILLVAERVRGLPPGVAVPAAGPVAVVVRAGRIAAVGAAAALEPATTDMPRMELPGTTLTPGLTDAHIHLVEWALARREVDLTDAASPAAAAAAVAAFAAGSPGDWVRGRGWNPHRWGGATPDRALLDALVADRPVALQSHDMHACWVNGAALARAGIDADTPDPDGGRIVRDADGRPTGLLLENAARLVADRIPAPALEDAASAVEDAQHALHRVGVTAVHSFPGIHVRVPDPLHVLERLAARDRLGLRVLQHLPLERLDDAILLDLRSGAGDAIRIGGVKMFLDGALGSRTAWMDQPYSDGPGCGMRVMDPADFRAAVHAAAQHGIASVVHAIGDAAVALAFEVLTDPALPPTALPHRVEHVQCCPDRALARVAAPGIVCSVQPAHLITDWPVVDRCWGPERASRTYAFRSLLDAGATLAFGSDAPVEPVDPRLGLFAAVHRTDLDGLPAGGWHPRQRLSPAEAFAGYTTGAARAAGLNDGSGTLTPGAPADLVAWDGDPFDDAIDPRRLRAVATIVAGRVVHS
jgi:predicted amidohydrolase YtcJ